MPRRSLTPPSCLRDAHLFFAGFSETLNTVTYLHQSLGCAGGGTSPEARFFSCASSGRLRSYAARADALPSDHANEDVCREDLYSKKPFQATCSHRKWGFNVTLEFEWKAFQWSERDRLFRRRVLALAANIRAGSRNIAVVLAGGPHHFSRWPEHKKEYYKNVSDAHVWPDAWIHEYIASTERLFTLFDPATLPVSVCVAWMATHIAQRHKGENALYHHPSAQHGFHDRLNRLTIALARRRGIAVVDTSNYTLSHVPKEYDAMPHRVLAPLFFLIHSALSTVHSPKLSSACTVRCFRYDDARSSDGDPYHGFPQQPIALSMIRQLCEGCAERRGVLRGSVAIKHHEHDVF